MTGEHRFGEDPDGRLRAGDADREAAVAELRRHHDEGRLTDAELEQRIAAAYHARTFGELGRLRADLPRPGHQALGPRRGGAGWPVPVPRWAAIAAIAIVGLMVLGALFGGPPSGPHHHPPVPVLALLLIAVVVWRRARGGGWGGRRD